MNRIKNRSKYKFIIHNHESSEIWQNRYFDTVDQANQELDQFFGFKQALAGLRHSGWEIKKALVKISIKPSERKC